MWKLIVSSVVLTAGVAFLVGCGDENNTTEITQVVGMQVLDEGEALPKCTADNEGAMVYSVDSAEAYYCVNKKWKSMEGNGGDGKNGEPGLAGADGKDGAAGADGKDGKDGKNGKDGSSCTAKALKNGKGYKIVCGGDSVGVVLNGEKGDPGVKGDSGVAGTSCSAEEDSAGVKITCTDGKTYTLSNGADGKDGRNFEEGWMVDHRDYHIYKIATIGTQTWMAENLNYETDSGSYCYNDSAVYCEKYGRLYTWDTAKDVCPEGWHLPDTTEWKVLFDAVFGKKTAGTMLKSTEGWNNNGNGSDTYSFSALPAGYRLNDGDYNFEGDYTYFWSSTEDNSDFAYGMGLCYYYDDAGLLNYYKDDGFSVRCLKD